MRPQPETARLASTASARRLGIRCISGLILFIVGGVCAVAGSSSAQMVDTFYERSYKEALRSSALGQHKAAAKDFRIACFGMLERTDRLGDCLARLALEEAEVGEKKSFLATVMRLIEVEQRFQGYSRSPLNAAERSRFEAQLEAWAPLGSYANVAAFKTISERKRATGIRLLPPAEQQQELDRLIVQDPTNPIWRVLRAELMLEQGRSVEAAESADRLMSTHPTHPGVVCLRGRTQAAIGACGPSTLEDLGRCGTDKASASEVALRCHIQNAEWDLATQTLEAMTPEQRQQREIKALAKEARRGQKGRASADDDPPTTTAPPGVEAPEAPPASPPSSSGVSSGPGEVERDVLDSSWKILHSDARDRFEDTYDSVRSMANRYPAWADAQHLSAELAYRLSLWNDAVNYFERAEEIVSKKPNLQFYLAVALYKSGDPQAAAKILDRCVPHIQDSDFVQFWVARIRDSTG